MTRVRFVQTFNSTPVWKHPDCSQPLHFATYAKGKAKPKREAREGGGGEASEASPTPYPVKSPPARGSGKKNTCLTPRGRIVPMRVSAREINVVKCKDLFLVY